MLSDLSVSKTQTCHPAPPFSIPSLSAPAKKENTVLARSSLGGKGQGWRERAGPAPCAMLSGDHSLPDAAHQHPSLIATQCLMTVIRKNEAAWGLEALTELGETDGVRT